MDQQEDLEFYLVWSKMPLCEEELSKIGVSHQIRPYLIIGKDDHNYYGFPATHNYLKSNRFCHNDYLEIIRNRPYANFSSFISLLECYKIPSENLLDIHTKLKKEERFHLMKRLSANNNLNKFPQFLQDKVNATTLSVEVHDVVTYINDAYFLNNKNRQNEFIGYKISKIPNKNAFITEFDGIKWFIKSWQKEFIPIDQTVYTNYLTPSNASLANTYLKIPHTPVEDQEISTNIHNLVVNSCFKYIVNDNNRKGIVLDKRRKGTLLLLSDENKRFIDGDVTLLSKSENFDFQFEGLVSDDKIKYLSNHFSRK